MHGRQTPALQVCVPCVHAQTLGPQDLVCPLMQPQFSSTVPSQLLSTPSHISASGDWPPMHAPHWPLLQICVPCVQIPTLLPHTCVSPSSTWPSQSSSRPLHVSVC